MTNIAFWKSAHPYLYIEKEFACRMTLTESEIKGMLAYIKQNLSEIWVDAIDEDVQDAYRACRDDEAY